MNKGRIIIISLLLISLLLCSCGRKLPARHDKPIVMATIYPYQLIAQQMLGSAFEVKTLLPANASPHSWSPTPLDMAELKNADVIISNGLGLETQLLPTLSGFAGKHIDASKLVPDSLFLKDNHAENGIETNPHIWTSPEMLTYIIKGLATDMEKRYPNQATLIQQNTTTMLEQLSHTDVMIKQERARYPQAAVVTLHNAFMYFLYHYNIPFYGAIEPSAGKEPAPRQLADLAATIRKHNIKTIYIEPQQNPKPAEVLAKELNLKIVTYDDLGTTLEVENISGFLYKNWTLLKEGF